MLLFLQEQKQAAAATTKKHVSKDMTSQKPDKHQ